MKSRSFLSLGLAAAGCSAALVAALAPARAEAPIGAFVQSAEYGDLGRITFETTEDVPGQALLGEKSIMVHFIRPVTADVSAIAAHMPHYVTSVERSGDDFIIHTTGTVALSAFTEGRKLVLDLSGITNTREKPVAEAKSDSPVDPAAAGKTSPAKPKADAAAKPPSATAEGAPPVKAPAKEIAEKADTTPAKPKPDATVKADAAFKPPAATAEIVPPAKAPVKETVEKAEAAPAKPAAAAEIFDPAALTLWTQITGGFGMDKVRIGTVSGTLSASLQRKGNELLISFDHPVRGGTHFLEALPSTIRDPVIEPLKGRSVLHLNIGGSALAYWEPQGRSYLLSVYQTPAMKPSTGAEQIAARPAPPAPAPAPPKVAAAPAPAAAVAPPAAPPSQTASVESVARPTGPLAARFVPGTDGGSLRFDWQRPVSAALFRRGDKLWVVFDAPITVNLDGLRSGFSKAEQLPSPDATILRLPLSPTLSPSPRRAGNSWIIDLRTQPLRAETPVELKVVDRGGKRVQFSALEAAPPISVIDPDAGDRVIVVPLASLGQGLGGGRHFVEFDALASAQGLAILPLADGLDVRSLPQMVDVSVPGGLTISSENERQARLVAPSTPSRFALATWRGDAGTPYTERRQVKLAEVAAASPGERSTARMSLARFYFANGFASEALGLLDAIRSDDPGLIASPGNRTLRGASLAYTGDTVAARQELGVPELADDPDAALWRGAAFAVEKNWAKAVPEFTRGLGVIDPYPRAMRHKLLMLAARSSLGNGDPAGAQERATIVREDDPTSPERQESEYVIGLAEQAKGHLAEAVEHWTDASAGETGPSQVRASLARTVGLVQLGKMQRTDAIAALEKLRYRWRGDNFELELMRQLGRLQVDDGDVRTGLVTWRSAVSAFPDRPEAKQLAGDMSAAFASVFIGDKATNVSPLKAVALYDEFRELTPNGPEGDRVIRNLADRLVKVDLLDRAGNLLDYQTKYRLTGKDRVRVSTQLALVRLLDHKPEAAIAALDIDAPKDIPPDLLLQRQELRGRALLELGRPAEALAILNGDTTDDADRLRADIYWKTQNWPEVAKLLPKLIGPLKEDNKLSGIASRTVLSLATALALGNDQGGLTQLRGQYGAAMEKGPDRQAFRVVAGTSDGLPTDFHALAGVVAQTGDFTGFLASYKQKLGTESLSAIN